MINGSASLLKHFFQLTHRLQSIQGSDAVPAVVISFDEQANALVPEELRRHLAMLFAPEGIRLAGEEVNVGATREGFRWRRSRITVRPATEDIDAARHP